MTDRQRIAITVASALALAVTGVGRQWSFVGSTEAHIWGLGFLTVCGLTVVGVFFVNRWWAVLPAVSTAGAALLATAIYTPPDPWNYESIPTELLVIAVILEAAVFVAFLSLGLLARCIWDWFRRPKSPTNTPKEIHR